MWCISQQIPYYWKQLVLYVAVWSKHAKIPLKRLFTIKHANVCEIENVAKSTVSIYQVRKKETPQTLNKARSTANLEPSTAAFLSESHIRLYCKALWWTDIRLLLQVSHLGPHVIFRINTDPRRHAEASRKDGKTCGLNPNEIRPQFSVLTWRKLRKQRQQKMAERI